MAKNPHEIVKLFEAETGIKLSGRELEHGILLASTLLRMKEDQEKATVTTSHCLYYMENAPAGQTVSHGTVYNNPNLKAMLDWAVSKTKEAHQKKDKKPDSNKDEEIRKYKRQIQGLIESRQEVDNTICENRALKAHNAKLMILHDRMMHILIKHGLDGELNNEIQYCQIEEQINNQKYKIDLETGELIEYHDDGHIDDQQ